MFYNKQDEKSKTKYIRYLQKMGSLSRFFSQNNSPYLDYRIAENIFCLAFNAENLSRSDVSVDAKKSSVGIGLKTFLHGNGIKYEKIAEFNKISNSLKGKTADEIINIIAKARNTRLKTTNALYGLNETIYHCVTRSPSKNYLSEFKMSKINTNQINIESVKNKKIINFTDGIYQYKFNLGKHTLFKKFDCTSPIKQIDIDILVNPFSLFDTASNEESTVPSKNSGSNTFVYLPLYAPSSSTFSPKEKSGLNQWNASGRLRDVNEVYIPIPSWIHKKFPNFFPLSNNVSFDLILPNGKKLQASTCQQGRKGLMSNPNKELGKWLLRDVLGVPEGIEITREILDISDIDSARVEKINNSTYKIDFTSAGRYEQFKESHKGL